jgi:Ca2+-binding EF-hand superfamily protein
MDRCDTNKNGTLEKEEWSNARGDISGADSNKDGKITREELTAYMQSRMSGGGPMMFGGGPGGGFGGPGGDSGFGFRREDGERRDGGREFGRDFGRDGGREFGRDGRDGGGRESSRDGGGGSSSYYTRSADTKSSSSSSSNASSTSTNGSDRKSYRALSATERLPKGLPEWFARNDANADGQVAMAEFSASWSNSTAGEFSKFDLNGDGLITPKECLQATDQGIARGPSTSSSSGSSNSGSSSRSRSSSSSSSSTAAATSSLTPTTTAPAPVEATEVKVDSKLISFAQERIKTYDKNSDGVLTKDEWDSMSKNPSAADKDGDGKITPTEYAVWTASK